MANKESRTPESFKLFVVATAAVITEARKLDIDINEFIVMCMTAAQDHPEDDMLTIFGYTLRNFKEQKELEAKFK